MTPAQRKSLSKFCSLMLRHTPDTFGLTPDADGFVPVSELLAVLQSHPRYMVTTQADVQEIVVTSDKQRFELRDLAGVPMIRARYGHTYQTLTYEPVVPPPTLLHGTPMSAWESIQQSGLLPMSRKYVHLTTDADVAQVVGKRKGKNVVLLLIRALEAHQAGVKFFQPAPTIYLAERVPPAWITLGQQQ